LAARLLAAQVILMRPGTERQRLPADDLAAVPPGRRRRVSLLAMLAARPRP